MRCPHCGEDTRDSVQFCTKCGRAVEGPGTPETRTPGSEPTPRTSGADAIAPPVEEPPQSPRPRRARVPAGTILAAAAIVAIALAALAVVLALTGSDEAPERSPLSAGTGSPTPDPSTPGTDPPEVDCSRAAHPPQGSAQRREVLDGLRRHYRYDGLYTVQFITVIDDWAYLEAAPFDEDAGGQTEPFRGYVTHIEDGLWEWRWEGPVRPDPDGPGDPPFPSDFTGSARDVLRC